MILINEDAETETERANRIELETWAGEHTEEFSRFVSGFPHDFLGDIVATVRQEPDNAKLGQELRLKIEAWIMDFAAEYQD